MAKGMPLQNTEGITTAEIFPVRCLKKSRVPAGWMWHTACGRAGGRAGGRDGGKPFD